MAAEEGHGKEDFSCISNTAVLLVRSQHHSSSSDL
jgi:hypothetical protein